MATLIGFVVGYLMGMRVGEKGWADLEESVRTIQASPEVRELVAGVYSTALQVVGQGTRVVSGRAPERPRLRVA